MRLVRCKNGHTYDADKLGSCPHCAGFLKRTDSEVDTYGKGQHDIETEVSDDVSVESMLFSSRKNVGSLVMTKGKRVGKAYTIFEGKNRIGRDSVMEIALGDEDTISRNGHAIITYNGGIYELSPLREDRDVLINGRRVTNPVNLKDRDRIIMGECELVFVQYDDVYE